MDTNQKPNGVSPFDPPDPINEQNGHPPGMDAGWAQPILTIDDFEPDRPCVRLYGQLFGLLHPLDLSLDELARFQRLQREFASLESDGIQRANAGELTPEQEHSQAEILYDKLGAMLEILIIDLDPETLARIPYLRRAELLQVFGLAREGVSLMPQPPTAQLQPLVQPQPAASRSKTSIGGKSSRVYPRRTQGIAGRIG